MPSRPSPLRRDLARTLVDQYAADERTRHIDAMFLPSRDRCIELIEALRRLTFPGFFEEQRLTTDNIAAHTADLLADIDELLYEQICQTERYLYTTSSIKKTLAPSVEFRGIAPTATPAPVPRPTPSSPPSPRSAASYPSTSRPPSTATPPPPPPTRPSSATPASTPSSSTDTPTNSTTSTSTSSPASSPNTPTTRPASRSTPGPRSTSPSSSTTAPASSSARPSPSANTSKSTRASPSAPSPPRAARTGAA